MLKNPEKSNKRPYYLRNKNLGIWMPEQLYQWFTEYLTNTAYACMYLLELLEKHVNYSMTMKLVTQRFAFFFILAGSTFVCI